MLDARRQAYLDALGIEAYVLRRDSVEGRGSGLGARDSVEGRGAEAAAIPDSTSLHPGYKAAAIPSLDAGVSPTPAPSPESPVPSPVLDWDSLRQQVSGCQLCPALVQNRTQTVLGVGNCTADWMVIGEAPGAEEDRQGEPFVGRAGQLLNAMLEAMGLQRQQVYIANVLKCRPPSNRDPQPEEAANCEHFLLSQVELIRPRIILALGRIAAQNLLKTEETLGRLRGRVHAFGPNRIPLVITYHPAYLLRSPEQKARAWEDLQLALRTLRQTDV